MELCPDHFSGWPHRPGVLNKDPTIWLDGARPPTKVPVTFLIETESVACVYKISKKVRKAAKLLPERANLLNH